MQTRPCLRGEEVHAEARSFTEVHGEEVHAETQGRKGRGEEVLGEEVHVEARRRGGAEGGLG